MSIVGNIECNGPAQVFGRIKGELHASDLLNWRWRTIEDSGQRCRTALIALHSKLPAYWRERRCVEEKLAHGDTPDPCTAPLPPGGLQNSAGVAAFSHLRVFVAQRQAQLEFQIIGHVLCLFASDCQGASISYCSRPRCSSAVACCSAVLTGTNRILVVPEGSTSTTRADRRCVCLEDAADNRTVREHVEIIFTPALSGELVVPNIHFLALLGTRLRLCGF
jgi:hypothetical protein